MTATTLTIRRAGMYDVAAIDRLLGQSYPKLLKKDYKPSVMVGAVPLVSRAKPGLVTSGSYYVAEDGQGRVLAASGWSWASPQGGRGPAGTAHVRHVVTDWRHVRQGIARRLMTHIVSQAVMADARRLDCLSTLTAVPFYAAMGFREIGPMTIELRPGIDFPAIRMERVL